MEIKENSARETNRLWKKTWCGNTTMKLYMLKGNGGGGGRRRGRGGGGGIKHAIRERNLKWEERGKKKCFIRQYHYFSFCY